MISHGDAGIVSPDMDEQGKERTPQEYKFRFTRAHNGKIERARSAPARPLTEIEEFRESDEFMHLEAAAIDANEIFHKSDGKLDLDSVDGHYSCKNFLNRIEELATAFKIKSTSRNYRNTFSQAYKTLYKEGTLCYLAEILDSAQEGRQYRK